MAYRTLFRVLTSPLQSMPATFASSGVLPSDAHPSIKPRYSTSPAQSLQYTTLKSPALSGFQVSSPSPAQFYAPPPRKSSSNKFLSVYRSVSWMLGFRETYSLLWFFVFGGALLGFCLARSMTLNPSRIEPETIPGEFFWFGRRMFRINYIIHIYLTIIGGIFVGGQFLPGLRRRAVLLHRINGYFCLFCLLPGNITGAIVAYKSFGGDVPAQTAYYFLALAIVVCGLTGVYNVKRQTRQHRRWMLRMVSYFCVIITARVIMLITSAILSRMGNHWAVWRCDEMMYLVDPSTAQDKFPQCFGVDPATVAVAVQASINEGKLGTASAARASMGMALWLATILHALGVEIYLRKTEDMNHNRYGYALEPKDYDGDGQPLWDYGRKRHWIF